MSDSPEWDFGRYRAILRVQARMLRLDPRLTRRLDESDLVQETLTRAHRNGGQFRGTTDAERVAWLRRIFERVVADWIDREYAQKRGPDREMSLHALTESSGRLDAWLAGPPAPPERPLEQRELKLGLAAALDRLDPDQRDAVILRYLQELPVPEVARRMGRTEKSVAGLLYRGLVRLRELYPAGGGTPDRPPDRPDEP
jgi:RNA polymerase sigma-70 factor (ECF subfamily)